MPTINVKGKVVYSPSLNGINQPVAGAKVKLYDFDVGNSNDLILNKTTNNQGRFSGTTANWQDKVTVPTWEPPSPQYPFGRMVNKRIDDPLDKMVLTLDISEDGNSVHLPFVYLGPNIEHLLVVPWGSPSIGSVNGVDCESFEQLFIKVKAAVDSQVSEITIKVKGPEGLPLQHLLKPPTELKAWINATLGIDVDTLMPQVPQNAGSVTTQALGAVEIGVIMTGIAGIIFAAGASTAVIILALAALYAVHMGYVNINNCISAGGPDGIESCLTLTR